MGFGQFIHNFEHNTKNNGKLEKYNKINQADMTCPFF